MATPNQKQNRSPKFAANRTRNPKPVSLLLKKPHSLPVLAAVDRHELLTNSMIQDLFFRDHRPKTDNRNEEAAMKRQADRAIRELVDAGLLECGMVWYEAESGFPYPYRYVQLTAAGARALEDADLPIRYKSHRKDKGQDSARHALGINEFYVFLQRACWQQGFRVAKWQDDRQLAAMEKTDTLLENVPDAFFLIEANGTYYPHFLEYDRGTETLVSDKGRTTDLLTKYQRYGRHLGGNFTVAPFFEGLYQPVVLNVTTGGPRRIFGMMDTCHQAGGRGSYWFVGADTLYSSKSPTHFWAKHWQAKPTDDPDEVSYRSLLNRLK